MDTPAPWGNKEKESTSRVRARQLHPCKPEGCSQTCSAYSNRTRHMRVCKPTNRQRQIAMTTGSDSHGPYARESSNLVRGAGTVTRPIWEATYATCAVRRIHEPVLSGDIGSNIEREGVSRFLGLGHLIDVPVGWQLSSLSSCLSRILPRDKA